MTAAVMGTPAYRTIQWSASLCTVRDLLCRTRLAQIFNHLTSLLHTNLFPTPSQVTPTLTSATHLASTLSTSHRRLISSNRGIAVLTKTASGHMAAADLPLKFWAWMGDRLA